MSTGATREDLKIIYFPLLYSVSLQNVVHNTGDIHMPTQAWAFSITTIHKTIHRPRDIVPHSHTNEKKHALQSFNQFYKQRQLHSGCNMDMEVPGQERSHNLRPRYPQSEYLSAAGSIFKNMIISKLQSLKLLHAVLWATIKSG